MTAPTTPEPRAVGCDAANATLLSNRDGTYSCRCLVCSRCKHHTGNATQGHYWAFCKVTGGMRDFHFCCPDDCELEAAAAAQVVIVDHGPVKPPYGTPERADWDSDHEFDHLDHTHPELDIPPNAGSAS